MPRSQRVELTKAPVAEVTPGEFDTGVVETVAMPRLDAVKSSGEKLAESLGLAAKALGTVFENRNKRQDSLDTIQWNQYGTDYGVKETERLSKIANKDQRIKEAEESFHKYMEHLNSLNLSQAGLAAATNSFGRYVAFNQEKALEAKFEEDQANNLAKLQTTVDIMFSDKKSTAEIFKVMDDSGVFRGNKKDRTDQYVKFVELYITKKQLENPQYDFKEDLGRLLTITTPDKTVPIMSTPEGQKAFKTLTLKDSQNKADWKAKEFQMFADDIVSKNVMNSEAYLKDKLYLTKSQLNQLDVLIKKNLSVHQKAQYEAFGNRITINEDLKGLTEEVIKAEAAGSISYTHKLQLLNRVATFQKGEKASIVKKRVAAELTDSGFSFAKLEELRNLKTADGTAFKYDMTHIKAGAKDSISREMPILIDRFLELNKKALDEKWSPQKQATEANNILDDFSKVVKFSSTLGIQNPGLGTFFATAHQDLVGKEAKEQLSMLEDIKVLAHRANAANYRGKEAKQFLGNILAMKAMIKMDPENGLDRYITLKEEGKLGRVTPKDRLDILSGQITLFNGNLTEDEMTIALQSGVGFDVFDTVFAYTKDVNLARNAMNEYIESSYFHVDVQAHEGVMGDIVGAVEVDDSYFVPQSLFPIGTTPELAQDYLDNMLVAMGKLLNLGSDIYIYPEQGASTWILKGDNGAKRVTEIELMELLNGRYEDATYIEKFK